MLRLAELLFEAINYQSGEFGLVEIADESILVLFHIPSMDKVLTSKTMKSEFVAGMVETTPSDDSCLYARQITAIVRSENYPGTGMLLYAAASSYFDSPITSDRLNSSSPSAQAAWQVIAKSPEWKQLSELDNYYYNQVQKKNIYTKVDPATKAFTQLSGPKTATEVDDCPLPPANSLKQSVGMLGSAEAYKYVGSFPFEKLLSDGSDAIQKLAAKHRLKPENVENLISGAATKLFDSRYKS